MIRENIKMQSDMTWLGRIELIMWSEDGEMSGDMFAKTVILVV